MNWKFIAAIVLLLFASVYIFSNYFSNYGIMPYEDYVKGDYCYINGVSCWELPAQDLASDQIKIGCSQMGMPNIC